MAENVAKNEKNVGVKNLKRFGHEKPAQAGPGRPPLSEEQKNERKILKDASHKAAQFLADLVEYGAEEERNRIRAAEIILSKTVPELTEGVIHDERPLVQLSDEQIARKLDAIRAHAQNGRSSRNGTSAGNGDQA